MYLAKHLFTFWRALESKSPGIYRNWFVVSCVQPESATAGHVKAKELRPSAWTLRLELSGLNSLAFTPEPLRRSIRNEPESARTPQGSLHFPRIPDWDASVSSKCKFRECDIGWRKERFGVGASSIQATIDHMSNNRGSLPPPSWKWPCFPGTKTKKSILLHHVWLWWPSVSNTCNCHWWLPLRWSRSNLRAESGSTTNVSRAEQK